MMKEHGMRTRERREQRRIFGSKRDKVRRSKIELSNEQLRDLYSSPSILKLMESGRMRWAEHVARMVGKSDVYRTLVEKVEAVRRIGRPRPR
jgi:hypothetical protein